MKNKTSCRIIALAMCLIMLLCFVACGANGGADSYLENGENQSSDSIILGDGSGMSSEGGIKAPPKEPEWEPNPAPIPFPYPDYEEVVAVVKPTEDNKVSEGGIVLSNNDGSFVAYIGEGTLLNEGVSTLKLTLSSIENSKAELVLTNTEESNPIDIHIEGISKDNKVPVKVYVSELLPKGLNMGNYRFYHVQNGETVEMKLLASGSVADNNSYEYDPLTGDVNLYVASFSEFAVVADTENAWNGTYDYSWYNADATTLKIANADQLAAFGKIVGGMDNKTRDSFAGKTVVLTADINLGDYENANESLIFHPIGYYFTADQNADGTEDDAYSTVYSFEGTFDGQGHTIANFYHNTWEIKGDYNSGYPAGSNYYKDAMGLFGYVVNANIENLTVDGFTSDGEFTPTGVIAAYAVNSNFTNIAITHCNPRVYNTGNGGIVGVGGNSDDTSDVGLTFTNITVDNTNKISALWGSWDVACGGIMGMFRGNGTVEFTNCHMAAQIDVYNDVCGNYQYYWYRYAGMLIGSIRGKNTIDGNYTVPDTTGITVSGCTVDFGDWNDYYYCELVANSLASYTHDHQFSRLEIISSIDEIKSGDTWTKAGNFLLIDGDAKTCYHIVNKDGVLTQHLHEDAGEETVNGETVLKEDKQVVYLPFNQLIQGDGWGVKHVAVNDFDGIEILYSENSKVKFKSILTENVLINDKEYKLSEIFEAIDGATVYSSGVYVTITKINDEDSVIGEFSRNIENWQDATVKFTGTGNVKIKIQDYNYCVPTEIEVTISNPQSVNKFIGQDTSVEHILENDATEKTLGDIFTAVENADIDSANVEVTVSDENLCTYTKNDSDWKQSTLAFTGEGDVTITITDQNYCNVATAIVTVKNPTEKEFKVKFPNVENYLYRVGNSNTITLGTLFEAELPSEATVTIIINNIAGDAAGTYTPNNTWANGTIKFTGTGVATITIDSNAFTAEKTLTVEVVDAYNVTTYSELKEQNSVLLDNITMSSGGTYRLTGNKVLYGNGFTFDVANGAYAGVEYDYASYVIYLENSRLDNVKINGAVYPEAGGTKTDDYYRAIVMVNGDCVISNSYISNGASPIRNGGNLELVNTTLKGGVYANLDLRNGHLILDNVTTINQVGANDQYNVTTVIVVMGIVAYQEGGSEELKITIRNNLTQYNYLSEEQAETYLTNTYATAVRSVFFGDDFSAYQNDGWINFGIISMNGYLTEEDVVDERSDKAGYFGTAKTVTLLGNSRNCYVYSFKPATTEAPDYTTAGQGVIAPNVSFDFTEKNYVAKSDTNDYCYEEGGIVYISMDEGDVFNWDTSILTATKNGETLSYTVTIDGVDYTGKSIEFNVTGEHIVEFAYTDNFNYKWENSGVVSFAKDYTETVVINVSVIKPDAQNAVFSFGANGTTYEGTLVTIGDKTYVMPNVTATVDGKIGSTTVSGTTVYYPITEMYTSDGTTAHTGSWYACFPIFKDALQIIDYADQGTGDPVTYNQTNVTTVAGIPSTLKATNPTSAFLYSMNATNYPPPTTPYAVSGAATDVAK